MKFFARLASRGLAPASIQDLGALMRTLATRGRGLGWMTSGEDPMRGVGYTARSSEQGQGPEYVREEDRPEFDAVVRLIDAYRELSEEVGVEWLAARAMVGAYGGLRPGERDALRLRDLRPDELAVEVEGAFSWPRGQDPIRGAPKNKKRRRVLVPRSTMNALVAVADIRQSEGAANDALLFADLNRPRHPLSEAATRKHHIDAALRAGWETVEVRRRADSRSHLGPDHRPRHTNYSLRHHAAVWMHDVAGFDWADVSRYLGHHSVAFTYAVYVRSGADADDRNRRLAAEL
ncbi:MAG: tyrosine-type recombinase/integrase [Acidimicrobiia bacterium]|nr:tyrosine-type recombinase/integrase [Acidimicrobiia bacterium]